MSIELGNPKEETNMVEDILPNKLSEVCSYFGVNPDLLIGANFSNLDEMIVGVRRIADRRYVKESGGYLGELLAVKLKVPEDVSIFPNICFYLSKDSNTISVNTYTDTPEFRSFIDRTATLFSVASGMKDPQLQLDVSTKWSSPSFAQEEPEATFPMPPEEETDATFPTLPVIEDYEEDATFGEVPSYEKEAPITFGEILAQDAASTPTVDIDADSAEVNEILLEEAETEEPEYVEQKLLTRSELLTYYEGRRVFHELKAEEARNSEPTAFDFEQANAELCDKIVKVIRILPKDIEEIPFTIFDLNNYVAVKRKLYRLWTGELDTNFISLADVQDFYRKAELFHNEEIKEARARGDEQAGLEATRKKSFVFEIRALLEEFPADEMPPIPDEETARDYEGVCEILDKYMFKKYGHDTEEANLTEEEADIETDSGQFKDSYGIIPINQLQPEEEQETTEQKISQPVESLGASELVETKEVKAEERESEEAEPEETKQSWFSRYFAPIVQTPAPAIAPLKHTRNKVLSLPRNLLISARSLTREDIKKCIKANWKSVAHGMCVGFGVRLGLNAIAAVAGFAAPTLLFGAGLAIATGAITGGYLAHYNLKKSVQSGALQPDVAHYYKTVIGAAFKGAVMGGIFGTIAGMLFPSEVIAADAPASPPAPLVDNPSVPETLADQPLRSTSGLLQDTPAKLPQPVTAQPAAEFPADLPYEQAQPVVAAEPSSFIGSPTEDGYKWPAKTNDPFEPFVEANQSTVTQPNTTPEMISASAEVKAELAGTNGDIEGATQEPIAKNKPLRASVTSSHIVTPTAYVSMEEARETLQELLGGREQDLTSAQMKHLISGSPESVMRLCRDQIYECMYGKNIDKVLAHKLTDLGIQIAQSHDVHSATTQRLYAAEIYLSSWGIGMDKPDLQRAIDCVSGAGKADNNMAGRFLKHFGKKLALG